MFGLPSIISLPYRPSLLLPDRPVLTSLSSLRNVKHLRIHPHLHVLIVRGLYKAFTLLFYLREDFWLNSLWQHIISVAVVMHFLYILPVSWSLIVNVFIVSIS